MAEPAEIWAVGHAHEPYIGRWSRLVARQVLAWLGAAELAAADPAAVLGVDPSAGYLAFAQARLADAQPDAPASFAVAAAACPSPTAASMPWSAGWC
jgi:hypothetical protein